MFIRIAEKIIIPRSHNYYVESVVEFEPKHTKNGKFDKQTQKAFDEMLQELKDDHIIDIRNIENIGSAKPKK